MRDVPLYGAVVQESVLYPGEGAGGGDTPRKYPLQEATPPCGVEGSAFGVLYCLLCVAASGFWVEDSNPAQRVEVVAGSVAADGFSVAQAHTLRTTPPPRWTRGAVAVSTSAPVATTPLRSRPLRSRPPGGRDRRASPGTLRPNAPLCTPCTLNPAPCTLHPRP